ncbi:family 1 glycosylhydrolase, partial [Bacillus pumilus]|uniref:family 1 glycosylhydrolase n=1 Tax=Bacillus pumilus TaxID=1408 RepID=UPI0011A9F298
YHRYKEHIALFAEIAFKSFTLSISSPPIFPNPHHPQPNQPPLPFYHNLFHRYPPPKSSLFPPPFPPSSPPSTSHFPSPNQYIHPASTSINHHTKSTHLPSPTIFPIHPS